MKKLILLFLVSILTLASGAQSKITKDSIIGTWSVAAIEVKDLIYFSVEKDSIALADTLKKAMAAKGLDPKNVEAMMKQQFAMFISMRFSFDADNKAVFNVGLESVESGYTVDAERSIINMDDDGSGAAEAMKAEMVKGMLRLMVQDPSGQEIWLVLKKNKS